VETKPKRRFRCHSICELGFKSSYVWCRRLYQTYQCYERRPRGAHRCVLTPSLAIAVLMVCA
jgi:hypothetical protein